MLDIPIGTASAQSKPGPDSLNWVRNSRMLEIPDIFGGNLSDQIFWGELKQMLGPSLYVCSRQHSEFPLKKKEKG